MKKTKILTSVLTFCVAVIALCFGVYAAMTLNYTVSGVVNYTVNQANVEITTQLYHSSFQAVSNYTLKTGMVDSLKTQSVEYITTNASTLGVTPVDINGDEEGTAKVYNSTTDADDSHNTVDGLAVEFKDNEALSYYVAISIKNIDPSVNAYARVVNQTIVEDMNSFVYVSEGYAQIAPQETKTIIIAFSLEDKTVAVADSDFEYEIEIGSGVMQTDLELVDSNNDNTPDYWGVQMGYTTDGTNKTPIYWRLISTDNGVTPYVFNKDVTPVGMSMFVLETPLVKNMAFHTSGSDYATSLVRSYINGQMLSDLNIGTGNKILNSIKTRTLNDLYKNNLIQETDTDIVYSDAVFPILDGITSETADKFYLLSMQETLHLLANFNSTSLAEFNNNLQTIKNSVKWADTSWWLRSASVDFDNYESGILSDGTVHGGTVTSEFAVRPAFNLYI